MQRFGRSAHKMKDRWGGGGVILAAIVAVTCAWVVGTYITGLFKQAPPTAGQDPVDLQSPGEMVGQATLTARDFTAYFVQVGAFQTEVGAQKEVERLAAKGIKAAIVPPSVESTHYRLFSGPFTTAHARDEAKENLKSAKIEGLSRAWDISDGPAVPASTMGQNPTWHQGVAVLNTYMQEAALWLEGHVSGMPLPVDTLMARGGELKVVADSLQAQAADPAVAELVRLAQDAELNASELVAMADVGATTFEEQRAMQNFLALLDSYRTWAPAQPTVSQ